MSAWRSVRPGRRLTVAVADQPAVASTRVHDEWDKREGGHYPAPSRPPSAIPPPPSSSASAVSRSRVLSAQRGGKGVTLKSGGVIRETGTFRAWEEDDQDGSHAAPTSLRGGSLAATVPISAGVGWDDLTSSNSKPWKTNASKRAPVAAGKGNNTLRENVAPEREFSAFTFPVFLPSIPRRGK